MQSESQGDDHGVPPDWRAWAARGILAATTGVAGIVLLFADLSLPVFVGLAGAGLLGVGLVTLASTGDPAGARSAPTWPAVATGAVCLVAGLVVLFWRAASLHTLVLVLAAALIVHGAAAVVRAFRGDTDLRVAGFFSGAAAVVFGVLAVSWPLITVTVFRIGFGAWLLFFAVRVLAEPGLSDRRRPASHPGIRRWARTLVAVVAFLLAVVLAGGSALLLHGDDRPAPGAFYTPPASVPGEPGALIRAESRPGAAPPGTQMWRILYTTTRPDGGPTVASGTVIAPARRGAGPLPLLTVAHGTSGIVPRCAPSLTAEPFADGAQAAVLDMVTRHGWAAVSSDYTGLGTAGLHPYLVGEAEARSVLDASRAAARIDTLRLSTETVIWGHSQGGHAALWAGQIAPRYAPGLTVKGIAALAPASDLYALAQETKAGIGGKTVSAYIVTAWDHEYPDLHLADHLTPGTAQGVEQVAGLCFNQQDAIAAFLRGSQIPDQVIPDAMLDGEVGDLLRRNTPTGPFPAPVLVMQGTADPLVTPTMQAHWVAERCAQGRPVDYRTVPGRGHMELVAPDSPVNAELISWTLARWNGAPATPTCGVR